MHDQLHVNFTQNKPLSGIRYKLARARSVKSVCTCAQSEQSLSLPPEEIVCPWLPCSDPEGFVRGGQFISYLFLFSLFLVDGG